MQWSYWATPQLNADGLNKNGALAPFLKHKEYHMIIIGFATNTSKLLPRIFCRAPRHCAPIVQITDNRYIMYQFIRRNYIAQISLSKRAIKLLHAYGWRFISLKHDVPRNLIHQARCARSCVELCCIAIGHTYSPIMTPHALYKRLKKSAIIGGF